MFPRFAFVLRLRITGQVGFLGSQLKPQQAPVSCTDTVCQAYAQAHGIYSSLTRTCSHAEAKDGVQNHPFS